MANVLSIVTYPIFPARLGGQKGIAFFNRYFSGKQKLVCVTIQENDPSFAPYPVINFMSNQPSRYVNIFNYRRIKRVIRDQGITHIILEHPYFGWMALLLKYFCKVKLVIHSHNIEAERFRTLGKWWWKLLWHYEKFIHRQADFTFCITGQDRIYFRDRYRIPFQKSAVITYGISWNRSPSPEERKSAKEQLLAQFSLPESTRLFLFNGTLDYGPNLDAVKNIVNTINPLFSNKNIPYRIIICGKGLPSEMKELRQYASRDIIYAGFVEDISLYFKGADVFLNPVTDGGGIKTKIVEALGYNLNVVSTYNGAIGVEKDICNGKLLLSPNGNWVDFAEQMESAARLTQDIPDVFFNHFYWDNIAEKAAGIISGLVEAGTGAAM